MSNLPPIILLLVVVACNCYEIPIERISVERLKHIAEEVNSLDTTWKAEVNFDDTVSEINVKHLVGTYGPNTDNLETNFHVRFDKSKKMKYVKDDDGDDNDDDDDDDDESSSEENDSHNFCENNGLPKEFDARAKWPKCKSISHIYDQGNCGSCWAVSVVSAFTDRVCIKSDGKKTSLRSVQQMLSCCHKGAAKDGCNGGWPFKAFDYIRRNGLSTGGDYDSKEGCQPYLIKPCAHRVNGTNLPLCSSYSTERARKCKLHCYNKKYGTSYQRDRIKAQSVYEVDPCAGMNEIYKNGPIVAAFAVYEDFYTYKSGVYQYTTGKIVGWHAARVIGWGEEKGVPYWLVTNSWNTSWGNNGFFKIIRGDNNCWFEDFFSTALPKL